jgi:hypothetical protein
MELMGDPSVFGEQEVVELLVHYRLVQGHRRVRGAA